MKKYITIAALLAAGTTFANAETITDADITWDFSWGSDSNINLTLADSAFKDAWTANTKNSEETQTLVCDKEYKSTNVQQGTLTPNQNIGNASGNSWTLTGLSFTNNSENDYYFDGITLAVFGFNGQGNFQNADTFVRNTSFTLTGGTANTPIASAVTNVTMPSSNPDVLYVQLKPTDGITVAAGETLTFDLTVANAQTTTTYGTFVGVKSITLGVIPEPSAFGMLAGLGALALVAARRRRK